MKFEFFVAARYLRAKRRQAVIGVITIISVVGVTAGVASLVIALSINAGFQKDLQDQLLARNRTSIWCAWRMMALRTGGTDVSPGEKSSRHRSGSGNVWTSYGIAVAQGQRRPIKRRNSTI